MEMRKPNFNKLNLNKIEEAIIEPIIEEKAVTEPESKEKEVLLLQKVANLLLKIKRFNLEDILKANFIGIAKNESKAREVLNKLIDLGIVTGPRKGGLGIILLKTSEEIAKKLGLSEVELDTTPPEPTILTSQDMAIPVPKNIPNTEIVETFVFSKQQQLDKKKQELQDLYDQLEALRKEKENK